MYRTLAEIVALAAERPLFVRWSSDILGDVRRGYSLNHQTGQPEAGLSVNALQHDVLSGPAYVAQQIVEYAYLSVGTGARPYLLAGRAAGRGADNEPVLVDVTVLGEIASTVVDEAQAIIASAQRARIREAAARLSHRLAGPDLHREVACVLGCWPEDVAAALAET